MRPDLCKMALVEVPFVDVINTMLDETLPLTVTEFEEWGNPKIEERVHLPCAVTVRTTTSPARGLSGSCW